MHLLIFSNHFILVSVAVDSELISETPGMMQEYTLDWIPVFTSYLYTFTHAFTPTGKFVSLIHLLACFW